MGIEPQPFLPVVLENGKRIILNESHVVTIEPKGKHALLKMSDGQELIVADPPYQAWENDCHTRKY